MNLKKKIFLTLHGIVLSSFIAFISFIFLIAENNFSNWVWHRVPQFLHFKQTIVYSLIVCIIAYLIVFILKKHWGNLPLTAHDRIGELKAKQTITYQNSWRDLVISLFILASGAGVGPEATLLGAIVAYSIWQADKLRFLKNNFAKFTQAKLKTKFNYLFNPHKYLMSYPEAKSQKLLSPYKKYFSALFILNGIVMFALLMKTSDQPSFITKMGVSHWEINDLWLLLPLVLYSFFAGQLYQYLRKLIKIISHKIQLSLATKLAIGAFTTFLISIFTPSLLFSGQHSLSQAVSIGTKTPWLTLLSLSFLKLIFISLFLPLRLFPVSLLVIALFLVKNKVLKRFNWEN